MEALARSAPSPACHCRGAPPVGSGESGRALPRSEERRVGKECRSWRDWSSDVCSSDLAIGLLGRAARARPGDEHILLSQANAYAYLADSFYMRSLWKRSLEARLRQHAIVEELHRSGPENLDVLYRDRKSVV